MIWALFLFSQVAFSNIEDLFVIVKPEHNLNVLHYQANVTPDCKFRIEDPIRIFWIMEDGSTEGLNPTEQKHLFSLVYKSKTEDAVTATVISMEKYNIPVPLTFLASRQGQTCDTQARTVIDGQPALLKKVRLSQFTLFLRPRLIEVEGFADNGSPLYGAIQSP